jgi:hypothetical protein
MLLEGYRKSRRIYLSKERGLNMSFETSKGAFETKLNVLLGRLLSSKLGLRAVSEYISHRKRQDVIIYVNGVKIVLEGSYSRSDAENDIRRRIEEGLGDLGIALLYKEKFPPSLTDSELEERLERSTFEVRLVIPEDISETLLAYLGRKKVEPKWVTGWMEAGVEDLVSIVAEAIQFLMNEEDFTQTIDEIERRINDFVNRLKSVDSRKGVAKKLYDIFYKLYGLSVGDYEKIDELIYAQAALVIFLGATFHQSVRAQLDLSNISSLCSRHGYRLGLKKAFEEILKIDYERVYEVAVQVVEALPPEADLALKSIVELAEECASKRALLRKDFSGKVYHRVAGDWAVKKNFATYFTTIPAAYLLAYLAVFTRTGVFSEFSEGIKVVDFACGSGTLLTAAYSALRDLYIHSSFGKDEVDLKRFHKIMLEENIWGFDALRYAVQIASMNLALQDPISPVERTNTYTIPLGKEDEEVVLGSLEFLKGKALPKISMYLEGKLKFMEKAEAAFITEGEIPKEIPDFDLIIMNPPFTRATGRGGREKGGLFGFIVDDYVREEVISKYEYLRKGIQEKLKSLTLRKKELADLPSFKELYKQYDTLSKLNIDELYNIGKAGEGLLFLYLAFRHIKEGGKVAFVLPKSLLTGISWFLARNLLINKFHLEHIVLSCDAENGYNFSESTSLSEVLIVARKRWPPEEEEKTKITVLLRKPSTSLEAKALALKIVKANGDEHLEVNGARAHVYEFPRRDMVANLYNWGRLCAFPSPQLNEVVSKVFLGRLYEKAIPIALLGEIADVLGLAVRRGTFHEVFKQVAKETPEAIPALIGGEEEIRRRMTVRANAWVICREPRYLSTASKFLVPDRIWVDTTHALALYCSEPVVSNIFFGLKPKGTEMSEDRLKSLILWLNTTWGVLSVLANRTETRGRWIELTITKWRLQPVLDVTKLDESCIKRLATIFDKYCEKNLRRLPHQFNPKDVDPVRRGIDEGFLEALGVKFTEKNLDDLYTLIYQNLSVWIGEDISED